MASVSRWQPDSRRRLQDAATELYAERGFAETTVAAVAERAGLTERTFFRHFADKREVLFGNEDDLRDRLVEAVGATSAGSVRDAIMAGLDAVASELQPRREELRRREPIIAAHPELQERELSKLASWTAALEAALRARGVDRPAAKLAAAVSIAVFNVAAQRWLAEDREMDLITLARATFADLTTSLSALDE
jgi:AcrR family transcriptional regulator